MALVSECPTSLASEEAREKTPSATAEEVTHDARGGADPDGRPWPAPYYLHNGLRRVGPYFHTYHTYVKGRWRERGILDVFTSEFRDRDRDYYVRPPPPRSP